MSDDYALLQKYKDDLESLYKLYHDTANVFYVQEMVSLNKRIALLEGKLKYNMSNDVIEDTNDGICHERRRQ